MQYDINVSINDIKPNIEHIIDLNNITFQYQQSSPVINQLSLKISYNESVAIVGQSGSGKSTLMHLIYGHFTNYQGIIRIFGHNIKQVDIVNIRRNIGMITQFDTLLYDFNVLENVCMPLNIQSITNQEYAIECLKNVGLGDLLDRTIASLSGGQKKRVMIARALVHKSKIILADEATGDLDQENADKILDIVLNLAKQKQMSVLWITHDQKSLCRFDRVIRL